VHHASPVTTRTKAESGRAAGTAGKTLAELMALPALAGASLLPEEAAADVRVSAVVLDDPAARPEDAGLLVSVKGIPKPVPSGVVAVLTRAKVSGKPPVPVIHLPDDRPWGEVIAALQSFISGQSRELEARDALRRVLIAGLGAPGIAEAAAEVLGSPVAIVDEYLDVLGTARLTDAREEALGDDPARAG
jgi:hypothetical protein